jgi:formylglycine-generating enzyme required for sulfatase activity
MGSPQDEEGRDDSNEQAHYRAIDRTIAVSTTEVTFDQFGKFRSQKKLDRYARSSLCPVNSVTWHEAAAYCNWLTLKEMTRDDLCYPEKVESGMELSADAIKRHGFRLPTEAEFECFCRANTETSRPFAESEELLPKYAWCWLNSGDQIHPVETLLPNTIGLFDVLGNVFEWCHDGLRAKGEYRPAPYPVGTVEQPANDADHPRETIENRTYRYLRGGSYPYSPAFARSASRYAVSADLGDPYIGFRLVRTLPDQGK